MRKGLHCRLQHTMCMGSKLSPTPLKTVSEGAFVEMNVSLFQVYIFSSRTASTNQAEGTIDSSPCGSSMTWAATNSVVHERTIEFENPRSKTLMYINAKALDGIEHLRLSKGTVHDIYF